MDEDTKSESYIQTICPVFRIQWYNISKANNSVMETMTYKQIAVLLSEEEGKPVSEEAVRKIVRRALDKIKVEAIRRELQLELLE